MGILNITPDSFSDGGDFFSPAAALEQARRMVAEGAAIIDVGGESTRPGAPDVGVAEEIRRVVPIIRVLASELPVPISIDTSKPEVMLEAVAAGAGMINDVVALRRPGALAAAAQAQVPVCLMHMQGTPRTMQQAPSYNDVVAEVGQFLRERIESCLAVGLREEQLVIDPGFGFGKTLEHNCQLMNGLGQLGGIGRPLLVGISRKSMFGQILGLEAKQRLYGSLAGAVLAAWQGARILRVHDVGPTVEALAVTDAFANLG